MNKLFACPSLVLIAGAVIISFSSVFVRISQVPAIVSAFYRVFFGLLVVGVACWIRGEFRGQGGKATAIAALAGVAFSADLFSWHLCIEYVGPGLATILGNCEVFLLVIAGHFFYRERLGGLFLLALPLAMLGLYMIIGLDNVELTTQYLTGLGLGGITAVSYGCFILLLRHVQSMKEKPPLFYYQVVVTAAASVLMGLMVIGFGHGFAIPTLSSLGALLGMGVLSQALAWGFITYFLPLVDASRAGLILLLQPSLSFVWDVAFFNRQTGVVGWIGVFMVLVAIYMGTLRPRG